MRESNGESGRDREKRIHRDTNIEDVTKEGQTYEAERQRASKEEYRHPDEQDDYRILDRHNQPAGGSSQTYGDGRERGSRGIESGGDEPLSSANRGFGENDRRRHTHPNRDIENRNQEEMRRGDWRRPESRWGGSESESGIWGGYRQGPGADEGRTPFGRESSASGLERGSGYRRESGDESHNRWGQDREKRRRGPYTGVGPKGYQRSDERLKDEVCDRLAQDGEIDASDIKVEVKNREVTLSGTVESRTTKYNVEELVDDISGVKDIDNRIKVRRPGEDRAFLSEQNGPSIRKEDRKRSGETDVSPQRI